MTDQPVVLGNTFSLSSATAAYQDIHQIAAPSAPAASYERLYFKSDDILYRKTPAGAESPVPGLLAVSTGMIAANAITPAVQSDTSAGEATTNSSLITNLTKTVTLTAGGKGFVIIQGGFGTTSATAVNTVQAVINGSATGFIATWVDSIATTGRTHITIIAPFSGLSGSIVFTAIMGTSAGTLTAAATSLDVYEFLK